MYSCSRYIVVHFIWLAFIFIFDPHGQALSDISFLSNDILAADDVGSDFILPELNQYSPLDELWRTSDSDQSLDLTDLLSDDDAATDDHRLFDASGLDDSFFDDNLLVADAQSCLQQPSGGKKLKARRDSQQNSCANPSSIFNPSISIPPPGLTDDDDDYTPEDERVRQIEEVKKYWCGDNPNPNGRTFWAVCSLDPYAHLIEGQLRSYFLTGLYYLTCKLDVYCCLEWRADRPARTSPLSLTPLLPLGWGLFCVRNYKFSEPLGIDEASPYNWSPEDWAPLIRNPDPDPQKN